MLGENVKIYLSIKHRKVKVCRMNFKIVSDSAADLMVFNSAVPFVSVPLTIRTNEREFVDNAELNIKEMLDYLEKFKGKSGSACPNVATWKNAFGDSKQVFGVTITSNLSGSYNAARVAAEEYMKENEGARVHIFDSLSTGPENVLIIEKINELILQDKDFDTIVEEVNEYKSRTHLLFALESMHNLANNGRVSPLVAKIAGILGIRVVGKASNEGTLEIVSKSRGAKNMMNDIVDNMRINGFVGGTVRIHHCENPAASEVLKEKIIAEFPHANVSIYTTTALCSFYAERGGILVAYEGAKK